MNAQSLHTIMGQQLKDVAQIATEVLKPANF